MTEDELRYVITVVRSNRNASLQREIKEQLPKLATAQAYFSAAEAYFNKIAGFPILKASERSANDA